MISLSAAFRWACSSRDLYRRVWDISSVIVADGRCSPLARSCLPCGLLGLGMAQNLVAYLAAWFVIGAGMGTSLYDAAFSTLGGVYGSRARGAITSVTLFGGFASTVCWPLSAFLVEHLGWRGACFTYAAIQIAIALPIHLILLPRTSAAITAKRRGPVRLEPHEVRVFFILAAIITISSAILSLMGTHLLPLLQARGLDLSFAVGLGMIVGPSQVGARLVEMFTGGRYHPFWTMVASVILIAVAAVMLLLGFPLVSWRLSCTAPETVSALWRAAPFRWLCSDRSVIRF